MEYSKLKQKAVEIKKLFGFKGPVTVRILDYIDSDGLSDILTTMNSKKKQTKVGRKGTRGKNSTPAEKKRAAQLVENLVNNKQMTKTAAYKKAAQKHGRSWFWAKAQHDKL